MREYGITTSQADYWLHVCQKDASFYLYPRKQMLGLIKNFQKKEIPTAKGFIVPIIPNLRENGGIIRAYYLGPDFLRSWSWKADTDAGIGAMGEDCVRAASDAGDFMLPVSVGFYRDKADQYKGKDFFARLPKPEITIEIKTDLPGGIWGTGNLFVQTHESQHIREAI